MYRAISLKRPIGLSSDTVSPKDQIAQRDHWLCIRWGGNSSTRLEKKCEVKEHVQHATNREINQIELPSEGISIV